MRFGHVKSINFAAHGAVGSQLTDKQIDGYITQGHYGEDMQRRLKEEKEWKRLRALDPLKKRRARKRKAKIEILDKSILSEKQLEMLDKLAG